MDKPEKTKRSREELTPDEEIEKLEKKLAAARAKKQAKADGKEVKKEMPLYQPVTIESAIGKMIDASAERWGTDPVMIMGEVVNESFKKFKAKQKKLAAKADKDQ